MACLCNQTGIITTLDLQYVSVWGSRGLSAIRPYMSRLFFLIYYFWQRLKKIFVTLKYMQCGSFKTAIISSLSYVFFCKQQCFCQRLHAFRVNTNDSNQRDSIKKYIVSNCCLKKSHLVALLKETWFIFLNPFLWQITSGRICVHSGVLKLKRKLYVLRWWSTFCLNVLEFPCVCVRLIIQLCIIFATLDLSEK